MRRLGIITLGVGLAMTVGCGSTTSVPATTPEQSAPAADAPTRDASDNVPGYSVSEHDTYDMANVACSTFPPSKIAHDFGMHTTDPDALASRYSRGYAAPLRQAAYDGCFDGITNP